MFKVSLSKGSDNLLKSLSKKTFYSLKDMFPKISSDISNVQQNVFSNSGQYLGLSRWAELSPGYARQKKRALGASDPILILSGELYSSYVSPTAPGHVEQSNDTRLKFGSNIPYAIKHQNGLDKMKKREPVRTSPQMIERWVKIIENGFIDKFKAV